MLENFAEEKRYAGSFFLRILEKSDVTKRNSTNAEKC